MMITYSAKGATRQATITADTTTMAMVAPEDSPRPSLGCRRGSHAMGERGRTKPPPRALTLWYKRDFGSMLKRNTL